MLLRCAIIVTGTPGTGKTTLSRKLAKETGARYISLAELVAKHGLFRGFDRTRRSKIVDVAKARSTVTSLLSNGVLTVIDTHLPEQIVPEKMTRQVLVLRCHPRILEARLRAKGWKPKKIRENVLAELLDACLVTSVEHYGWHRVVELDTSHKSLKNSVGRATRLVTHGLSLRKAKVDWITTLEREGLLDRYLT
jgi:adenylate kinase